MQETSTWLIVYRPRVGFVCPLCNTTEPGTGMNDCPVCIDEPDDRPEAVQRVYPSEGQPGQSP